MGAPGRVGGWSKAGEVDSDALLGWPWIHIQGRRWDEEVEVIGKVLEIKRTESGLRGVAEGERREWLHAG